MNCIVIEMASRLQICKSNFNSTVMKKKFNVLVTAELLVRSGSRLSRVRD